MVESVISLGIFLWILFFSMELGLFVYDVNTLSFWLDRTARNRILSESTVTGLKNELINELQDKGIATELAPADIRVCENFASECATESTGAAGNFFTITINYDRQLITFPLSYPVTVSVSVRNETFGAL